MDKKSKLVQAILSAGKIVDIEVDGKASHRRGEHATIWTFEYGGQLFEYDGWWEFVHPTEGIIPYPDEEEDDA